MGAVAAGSVDLRAANSVAGAQACFGAQEAAHQTRPARSSSAACGDGGAARAQRVLKLVLGTLNGKPAKTVSNLKWLGNRKGRESCQIPPSVINAIK